MNDYVGSVEGCCSWIKKLTIGPLDRVAYPLRFYQDELLMQCLDGSHISYNLHTQKLRNLGINCLGGTYVAFSYVKSLVSVTSVTDI